MRIKLNATINNEPNNLTVFTEIFVPTMPTKPCHSSQMRIAHATVIGFVDAVKEEAYDTNSLWKVTVKIDHQKEYFIFCGDNPWEYASFHDRVDEHTNKTDHEQALWAYLYE